MERRISRISRPNTVCLCCQSLGEGEEEMKMKEGKWWMQVWEGRMVFKEGRKIVSREEVWGQIKTRWGIVRSMSEAVLVKGKDAERMSFLLQLWWRETSAGKYSSHCNYSLNQQEQHVLRNSHVGNTLHVYVTLYYII